MSDIEKNIQVILSHISHVQENARILAYKKIESGEEEFGLTLLSNSLIHDQSKIANPIERQAFVYGDKDILKRAVEQHRYRNAHHPEFWPRGIFQMPKVAKGEMVCDVLARSQEMGTNIKEWIDNEATSRFGFKAGDEIHTELVGYLDLILTKPFTKI